MSVESISMISSHSESEYCRLTPSRRSRKGVSTVLPLPSEAYRPHRARVNSENTYHTGSGMIEA